MKRRVMSVPRSLVPAVLLLAPAAAGGAALAGDAPSAKELQKELKELGREAGKVGAELGREAGKVGAELRREAADAAQRVWHEGRKVGAPLLAEVEDVARKAWRAIVEQKEEALEELRRGNERLRRKLEDVAP